MEKIIKKALSELNENEDIKEKSLKEFRHWISKHPFIKRCRNDDTFLLQFLRIRKYNMVNACKSFENFFVFRQKYMKWSHLNQHHYDRVWNLFESGFAYPLVSRDYEGKKIIFIQVKKFDTQKFNSDDAIRLFILIVSTLMEEEETQIAGISSISDYTDASYQYFRLFSLRDIREFAYCAKHATIGREKENFFVNLPSIASILFEVGKKALNEKLRSRIITTKSIEELTKRHVDLSILPKELGGVIPEKDQIAHFKETYKKHQESLDKISDCEIDWNASGIKF